MTRELIDSLVYDNVKIFSVQRQGRTYYINLNHPDINWSSYSNFYLYSGFYNCNDMNQTFDYIHSIEDLNEYCTFYLIESRNSLKSTNLSKKNKPKIIKSKVVKEIKEDKHGTNLVLELRNQEIYLSNALLSYLDLKDGSKVNFASDDETNKNYLYIETEENEGYEIKENIIVCPHNVILFKTLFGTDVLYLDIREENLAEEPSYVFYPISEENPQEINSKKYPFSDSFRKIEEDIHEKLYGKKYYEVTTTGIKSSPVVEKISPSEPLDLMEDDEEEL
jgi:hypothetical protein